MDIGSFLTGLIVLTPVLVAMFGLLWLASCFVDVLICFLAATQQNRRS